MQNQASFWVFNADVCFLASNCCTECSVRDGAELTSVFLEEYVIE
jgi:hypothetical protein